MKLIIGIIATVFSFAAMVLGIMLVNFVNLTFWRMIWYDLIFVVQFLTFLWCAIVFTRRSCEAD